MTTTSPAGDVDLVANARMYAINSHVTTLWQRLFQWVADQADVSMTYIAHAWPEPLETLWRRTDLGCAFICGYPFATWASDASARPEVLAAPIPSPARYGGKPVYWTDIVVRAGSSYATIDDIEGLRFGYTIEHSQSGFRAPRRMFAERVRNASGHHFVGPLYTPRGVVDAVLDARVEAGPLDAYWHDLLRRHEPETAAQLRTIATTPMTPIPPLVCWARVSASKRERLAGALTRVASEPALVELRDALLLRGFASVSGDDYRPLAEDSRVPTSTDHCRQA